MQFRKFPILGAAIFALAITAGCKKKDKDNDAEEVTSAPPVSTSPTSSSKVKVSGKASGGAGFRLQGAEEVVAYLIQIKDTDGDGDKDVTSEELATAPLAADGSFSLEITGADADMIGNHDYLTLSVEEVGSNVSMGEAITFEAPEPGADATVTAEAILTEAGYFLTELIQNMPADQLDRFVGDDAAPLDIGSLLDEAEYLADNFSPANAPDSLIDAISGQCVEDIVAYYAELEAAGINVNTFISDLNENFWNPEYVDATQLSYDYLDNIPSDMSVADQAKVDDIQGDYESMMTFSDVFEEYPELAVGAALNLLQDATVDYQTEEFLESHPNVSAAEKLEWTAWLMSLLNDPADLLLFAESVSLDVGEPMPAGAADLPISDYLESTELATNFGTMFDAYETSYPELLGDVAANSAEAAAVIEDAKPTQEEPAPSTEPSTQPSTQPTTQPSTMP